MIVYLEIGPRLGMVALCLPAAWIITGGVARFVGGVIRNFLAGGKGQ